MSAPTLDQSKALLEPLTGYTPGPWSMFDAKVKGHIASHTIYAKHMEQVGRAETSVSSMADWYCRARELGPNAALMAAAPSLAGHLAARIAGEEAAIFRAKVAQGELEIADKQIAFVAGERDAALAEVARLRALLGQRRDPAAVMERG